MENADYQKLFIGGDLSGIQSFLYNISSKKAAVSLKGRSFYLLQYMKNVCDSIKRTVEQAGAKNVDVIYCSGGKFYMLADNSESIRRSVDETATQLRQALWKEHLGQLGLNIAYVSFTENADGTVCTDGATKRTSLSSLPSNNRYNLVRNCAISNTSKLLKSMPVILI